MATDIKDFLDQTKTDIIALGGGTPTFDRVLIMPVADIEILMQNPRWPAAIIVDGGGTLDEHNHKLWKRTFDVIVVDAHPRDTFGEESTRQMLDLGEALVAGLEYNNTDGLFLEADSDVQTEITMMGLMIAAKTYTFAYEIQRA